MVGSTRLVGGLHPVCAGPFPELSRAGEAFQPLSLNTLFIAPPVYSGYCCQTL